MTSLSSSGLWPVLVALPSASYLPLPHQRTPATPAYTSVHQRIRYLHVLPLGC